jgi:hypothetical protein
MESDQPMVVPTMVTDRDYQIAFLESGASAGDSQNGVSAVHEDSDLLDSYSRAVTGVVDKVGRYTVTLPRPHEL